MEKVNYFNAIPWREALLQLGHCRFMDRSEFADGTNALKGKKIVIVGCGAQGLHQGMNLRDSGLDVSYALRESAISEKRQSWKLEKRCRKRIQSGNLSGNDSHCGLSR